MRRGKEIAQGAHASLSFLTNRLRCVDDAYDDSNNTAMHEAWLTEAEQHWIDGHFTKVCLQVDSEAELVAVYDAAKAAGLEVHMIEDEGATEFHGVITKTCLAIGPVDADLARPVTGKLKLY